MADLAKFALRGLLVDQGAVSSWPADSRRAIAHYSDSTISFPNVAQTMMSAHSPRPVICCVAAPRVAGI
jgi:hypothetical protein